MVDPKKRNIPQSKTVMNTPRGEDTKNKLAEANSIRKIGAKANEALIASEGKQPTVKFNTIPV
jgi:hypothetical protein